MLLKQRLSFAIRKRQIICKPLDSVTYTIPKGSLLLIFYRIGVEDAGFRNNRDQKVNMRVYLLTKE